MNNFVMPVQKLTLTIQIKDNCFQSFVRTNFSPTRENFSLDRISSSMLEQKINEKMKAMTNELKQLQYVVFTILCSFHA